MDCRAGRGKPYFGRGGFHRNQAAPGNVGKRGRKIRGTFKVETHVFLHEKGIKESSPMHSLSGPGRCLLFGFIIVTLNPAGRFKSTGAFCNALWHFAGAHFSGQWTIYIGELSLIAFSNMRIRKTYASRQLGVFVCVFCLVVLLLFTGSSARARRT
jgi:hypothetical protein